MVKFRDLGVRTLINGFGALLIAFILFLATTATFSFVFALFVALVAAIAIWEYNKMIEQKQFRAAFALTITAAILYIGTTFLKIHFSHLSPILTILPQVILWLAFFGCFVFFAGIGAPTIPNIAASFFGVVYIAIPLSLVLSIMYFFKDSASQGAWWVIYLIVVTKGSDIGGYFIGSHFGKHKLATKFSPNKTLEGALGGLVVSIIASSLFYVFRSKLGFSFSQLSVISALGLGLIIGALGQIGDLAESLLKRDAGVKDSNTIPGVGGVLDMIDSLLFTAPLLFIYLVTAYDYHY